MSESETTPLMERSFSFGAGVPATVECRNCGWTSQGRQSTPCQVVFGRSNGHECPGVEPYASMVARDRAKAVTR